MVLEGLHQREVVAVAHAEPVVTIQLEQGSRHRVHCEVRVGNGGHLVVEPVLGGGLVVALQGPHKLLHGVIEVQLQLLVGTREGLLTSELQLLDQVLVRQLGEPAALVGIQEDVIHPQGGVTEDRGSSARSQAVSSRAELDVNLHLVVLEGNQG